MSSGNCCEPIDSGGYVQVSDSEMDRLTATGEVMSRVSVSVEPKDPGVAVSVTVAPDAAETVTVDGPELLPSERTHL
jgi:hypothetical protein